MSSQRASHAHICHSTKETRPTPNPNRARPFHCSCCVSVMPTPQIVYYQLGAIKVSWPYCVSFIFGHRVTFFYCRRCRRCCCSLCVQRFLSSTACQHKMDMYQLIFAGRERERERDNDSPGQQWEPTVVRLIFILILILMLILIHIHIKIQCAYHSARFPGQFV